jgi:hypothetical protein
MGCKNCGAPKQVSPLEPKSPVVQDGVQEHLVLQDGVPEHLARRVTAWVNLVLSIDHDIRRLRGVAQRLGQLFAAYGVYRVIAWLWP